MNELCAECGGACCKDVTIPVRMLKGADMGWLTTRGTIERRAGEMVWRVAARCPELDEHGRCRIYERRPFSCRAYEVDGDLCRATRGVGAKEAAPKNGTGTARAERRREPGGWWSGFVRLARVCAAWRWEWGGGDLTVRPGKPAPRGGGVMDQVSERMVLNELRPRKRIPLWQWAEENVVLSRKLSPGKPGRYESSWTPFWREPMEATEDRGVRKVVVLKPSQGGGTENLILMPMRRAVAERPRATIYCGAQQEETEAFMEERLKPALKECRATRGAYERARKRGMEIYFEGMNLAVTWAKSGAGLKQRPIELVFADELSTWPQNALPKLERRTGTVAFPTIVAVSAPDARQGRASRDDPIFIEWGATDQRRFHVPDPGKKGKWCTLGMGWRRKGRESRWGLKWSEKAKRRDGSWDLDRVAATAHYVTQQGARIRDKEKLGLLQRGEWRATAQASADVRGYHLNALYLPWVTFGEVAVAFLRALAAGKEQLRVFVYEWLAEPWADAIESVEIGVVEKRQAEYEKGQKHSEVEPFKSLYENRKTMVLGTVDVQKDHFWMVLREWVEGGDSGLISWAHVFTWEEIEEAANEAGAMWVLVDCNYARRTAEVYENCVWRNMVPCRGADRRLTMPYVYSDMDPFEGKRGGGTGTAVRVFSFDSDIFRLATMERIRGEHRAAWWVYRGIEREYRVQVTAEERIDGKWVQRYGANHMWDCEVMQTFGATWKGFASVIMAGNGHGGGGGED